MRISFKKYIILICVTVLSLSTVAQIKVINNKGTFFQIDTSKWALVGVDIYNKNQIGNVGVGTFPYNARFVVDNGNSTLLPAFKLKYPFSGAISDSLLTWNPEDSTVRKIPMDLFAWSLFGNSSINVPANPSSYGASTFSGTENWLGTKDNAPLTFGTNSIERMRILPDGSIGIGTAVTGNNSFLTINSSNSTFLNGIYMNMANNSGTAYGLNVTTTLQNVNGFRYNNTSSSNTSFYGVGSELTAGNIVSSYLGYRNNTGKSYGVYGINGTNATYATNANTWAAFLRGRVVISSETSPTSLLGIDLEIRNTTTGANIPAVISLRQTNNNPSINNNLSYINFGDNYVTTPQAQIRVFRDAAAGGISDLPTAISFSTTPDGTGSMVERVRISNAGYFGIGTTNPLYRLHVNGTIRFESLGTNTTNTNILTTDGTGVVTTRILSDLLTGSAITSLNGLTNSIQTFSIGTTGTDFNISSTGTVHTLNLPDASSANRGALTNTDWITFNNKISSVTATTVAAVTTVGTTATINNTGAYWNANQLQNRNVASTAPSDGQVLSWNNTSSQWEPSGNTYQSAVVEIYDAVGTQVLTSSFANITFGSTNISDAGYTVGGSGSQITVTTAGTYRITYRISARCTTNQGNAAEFQLTRNGIYVTGTRGYSKHHNSDRPHGTVTVVKIISLSANDIIRVQGRQYSAFGSISLSQDGSSLIIERIK